jgi:PKD repeat protein
LNLTAGFEADETLLLIGGTVNYSNLSSGLPISWEWTFEGGDPATFSGKEPPEIKYLSGGMFDTKLVVSDGINYDTLLLTEYIHVVGKVFPNPASKIVNIYLDVQLPAVVYAEIYDLIGQKVLSKEFPNQSFRVVTLDISTLPVGIYLVRLQIQQRFIFAKIVVNH